MHRQSHHIQVQVLQFCLSAEVELNLFGRSFVNLGEVGDDTSDFAVLVHFIFVERHEFIAELGVGKSLAEEEQR